MSNQSIYQALLIAGLTPEGACGMMGNMMAESSMKSNIAQRGMTSLSDEQYTLAADMGTINFSADSVGYGLCQWTYGPRKAALLKYAKQHNASVGDEAMQVQFCLQELKDYGAVNNVLRTSHDLKQCSDIVCTQFERPAYNNLDARYKFSLDFFNQFGKMNKPNTPAVEIAPKTDNAQNSFAFTNLFSTLANKIGNSGKTTQSNMPVLKEGDSGAGVAAIQVALKYHKVDIGDTGTLGLWEAGTTMGVKTFQARNGITQTGVMDGKTWEKMMQ